MRFADWLAREKARIGLTMEQFGHRIGRTTATVSRIASGKQKPDWDTMQAISRETSNEVTPNDFIGEDAAA